MGIDLRRRRLTDLRAAIEHQLEIVMHLCLSPNGPMVFPDASADRIFAATIDGVVELTQQEDASSWLVSRRSLPGKHVSAVLHDPATGHLIAATHNDGIHVSTDAGRSWKASSGALSTKNFFSLAQTTDEGRPVVLAGGEPVSLFVSYDGGLSWEERPALSRMQGSDKWTFPAPPHHAHLKSIAVDPEQPETIYGCIEQGGLMKSRDCGRSWVEITSYWNPEDKWYRDIHKVVPIKEKPGSLFMTTGMGLYFSSDEGETWSRLTDLDFDIRYPDHLIVAPNNPDQVFLSGAGQSPNEWRASHNAGATIRMSLDAGKSWELANRGLRTSLRPAIEALSIAIHDGSYTLFLGTTDGEVYMRPERSAQWNCIVEGIGPVSKVGHYKYVQRDSNVTEPAGIDT